MRCTHFQILKPTPRNKNRLFYKNQWIVHGPNAQKKHLSQKSIKIFSKHLEEETNKNVNAIKALEKTDESQSERLTQLKMSNYSVFGIVKCEWWNSALRNSCGKMVAFEETLKNYKFWIYVPVFFFIASFINCVKIKRTQVLSMALN